jgi:hypothetical protein
MPHPATRTGILDRDQRGKCTGSSPNAQAYSDDFRARDTTSGWGGYPAGVSGD